jgi:hypothetical protein
LVSYTHALSFPARYCSRPDSPLFYQLEFARRNPFPATRSQHPTRPPLQSRHPPPRPRFSANCKHSHRRLDSVGAAWSARMQMHPFPACLGAKNDLLNFIKFRFPNYQIRKRKGREPDAPDSMYREAPFNKGRQAAPEGRALGRFVEGCVKFAVSESARSQSYSNWFSLRITWFS